MRPAAGANDSPFGSIDDVVDWLETLGGSALVFSRAYLATTLAIRSRLRNRGFENAATVTRAVVAYAERYRHALRARTAGWSAPVPEPWRIAFETIGGDAPAWLQLLLSTNAHLRYDLPFAIVEAGFDPAEPRAWRDFGRINDAIRDALPGIRLHVTPVAWQGRLAGSRLAALIDRAVMASLRGARHRAWLDARAVAAAETPASRQRTAAAIERRAIQGARRLERLATGLTAGRTSVF